MAIVKLDSLRVEADVIVLVALGAVSALARLGAWLERAARDGSEPPLDADDPALLAALGLISLSRTAARWLDVAASVPRATAGADGPHSAPAELLR